MFRADVNAIILDARVVDSEGRFVRGLTKDDFKVFENDVEQLITTFSLVEIPTENTEEAALAGVRVERDVVTNSNDMLGRIFVLALNDQVHPLQAPTVRAIAKEFIEHHVTDLDRVALVTVSGRDALTRQFTNNKRELNAAIDKFEGGIGQEANINVRRFLRDIVRWLSDFSGRRKALILVGGMAPTAGLDPDAVEMSMDDQTIEAVEIREIVDASARGNVSLYSIDHNGNPAGPSSGIKPIDVSGLGSGTADRSGRPTANTALIRMDADSADYALADATGGFALVRSNDFVGAFDRIIEENSSYYLLGYQPTNQAQDGKFRKIRIELRNPELSIRARTGYTAAKPNDKPRGKSPADMAPALATALQSPLPVAGLTIAVSAPVFRGKPQPFVDVIVEARGRDLLFTQADALMRGGMQLVIAAAGPDGKVKAGQRGDLSMRLSANTHESINQDGVRLLSRLSLKPGKYQLRVAAVDSGGGTMRGAVQTDLDVPDFSKTALTMSGIALGVPSRRIISRGTTKEWTARLDTTPSAAKEFTRGNAIETYVELYDNKKDPHDVATTVRVHRESGETVFRQDKTLKVERGKENTTTLPLRVDVPASALEPGHYILSVDATSHADAKKPFTISRMVPFTIRP